MVNTPNPKAQIGDRVRYLEWRFKNDSLIYRNQPGNWIETFLPPRENLPPQPPGNYIALTLMGAGDSLKLSQPMSGVEKLPDYLTADDTLNYVIKMLEVSTPGEVMIATKLEQVQKEYAIEHAQKREQAVIEMTQANIDKYNRGGFGEELIQRQSGLKYVIHQMGTGKRPVMRQEVTVHYAGFLMDGTNFDNSFKTGEPISFPLGMKKVIAGWEEGIGMLAEGSQATIFVPYQLAYGEAGSPPKIPSKADLAFYVEIITVQ